VIQAGALMEEIRSMLASIDSNLAARAEEWMKERQSFVRSVDEVKKRLDDVGGIVEAPWCGGMECGEGLELKIDARILGVPYTGCSSIAGSKCVGCGKEAAKSIRVGRSY
jgi:prolyl-tRNA synthetase